MTHKKLSQKDIDLHFSVYIYSRKIIQWSKYANSGTPNVYRHIQFPRRHSDFAIFYYRSTLYNQIVFAICMIENQ